MEFLSLMSRCPPWQMSLEARGARRDGCFPGYGIMVSLTCCCRLNAASSCWRLLVSYKKNMRIDLIHDPPSLHTLKDWWENSNVTWFLRGQTNDKSCKCKKSPSSLFTLDNRKWRTFHNKDDNGKLWVAVIIVTTLDAVVTVDVLPANNNDVN